VTSRLAAAIEIAREAGDLTLRFFGAERRFGLKDDASPVTAADLEAERAVRQRLASAFPGEPVLGEEEGGSTEAVDRWVVDPIDGTKSFVCGVPLYATLLSYEVDFEPVVAVCHFPALGQTLWAEKGSGAFMNGESCHVADPRPLDQSVVSCGGHRSMADRGRMDGLLKIAGVVMTTRTWSDAYGHALVASGRIDAMLDPVVNRWDVSAASLIVHEAGGMFMDFSGKERLSDEAISCAPWIAETVLEAFR
jgi:histidinol phosphatase-like enzyme (inositol monophosphatase family)